MVVCHPPHPPKKKGDGVRPVAVGDTLRKLFGKRMMRSDDTIRALASLRPTQLGFNGKGACELAGTTLQACLDSLGPSEDWVCLSVDIVNAFNTIDRTAILNILRTRAPQLVPWAQKSLGQPTLLLCATAPSAESRECNRATISAASFLQWESSKPLKKSL